MGSAYRLAPALLVLAALPAGAQAQAQAGEPAALRQQQTAKMADGYAQLQGFGEGVAAAMPASLPVSRQKIVPANNGKLLRKTYRQPRIELTTWSAEGKTHPLALTIARPGYPLPLGLHIGDPRGAVEDVLGAPPTGGDTLVLKRTQGEGCEDPITLTFRGQVLAQVTWTWQTCMD